MRIAPEGWPFILPGWALVAMGAWGVGTWGGGGWLWALEAVLLLLALWLIVFFPDPARPGPRGERFVIAPTDGRVVAARAVRRGRWGGCARGARGADGRDPVRLPRGCVPPRGAAPCGPGGTG